jgi:hypothetical protein
VSAVSNDTVAYEIKQGEVSKGKAVLTNESAGLILLLMDLAQPWSCPQKYKVMDELHSDIFGRPDVIGTKILGYRECFSVVESIDDKHFAYYNLTKYFLAYAVVTLIRTQSAGVAILQNMEGIRASGTLPELIEIFTNLARSLAYDIHAQIVGQERATFNYKNELKNPTWWNKCSAKLIAQYSKDVMRKKAEPIQMLCSDLATVK